MRGLSPRQLRSFSLLFFSILFASCAALTAYGRLERSARKNFQLGHYDQAVLDCAQSLRINPEYPEAQALIQDAFRAAVISHESKLDQLERSSDKFRWDEIVSEYVALSDLNRTIQALPTLVNEETGDVIVFDVKEYSDQLENGRRMAADVHYQEGSRLSELEGIDNKKRAARQFKRSLHFVAGYKDAAERYELVRQDAILRMAIIPFEDLSGKRRKYGAVSETIIDEVVSDILSDPSATEFLEIISRDQLDQVMREQELAQAGIIDEQTAARVGKLLGVHEILSGKITQIIYTPARTAVKTAKESARVVIRKEKYKDMEGKTKTRNVWGEVEATVKIYTRTTAASIRGSYKIIDVETARILQSASLVGESEFEARWATYAGDERALGWGTGTLVRKDEQLAPVEADMVSRAANRLSKSLATSLKEYAI